MLSTAQAHLVCTVQSEELQVRACRQRLVAAARLERRARRQIQRAERAARRAEDAASQARLAWAQLT